MKPQRIQHTEEFGDVFGSLAIVSVTLQDKTLDDQIREYAKEYGGETITKDEEGDGLFLEFQFEDPMEAEEFHQFLLEGDWFGEEVSAVSLHTAEEEHIGNEDDDDIIHIDVEDFYNVDDHDYCDNRRGCNCIDDQEDMNIHIEQQEEERDEFRSNYIPDVGGFDEESDAFNAQSHGGDVVKNDYNMPMESLRRLSCIAGRMTLREFKENRPVRKSSWNRKWKNDGPNSPIQSSSQPYHSTTRGKKKDPKSHHFRNVVARNGSGWNMIQDSTDQETDQRTDYRMAKQVDDFHAKNRKVRLISKQRDLRESVREDSFFENESSTLNALRDIFGRHVVYLCGKNSFGDKRKYEFGFSIPELAKRYNLKPKNKYKENYKYEIDPQKMLVAELNRNDFDVYNHSYGAGSVHGNITLIVKKKKKGENVGNALDETIDEMSDCSGIGGYTVPLGGKPANMRRNADVWRRNNQSKKPKSNDTVNQNLAPTQSAISVKKDRKKAKAPYTSFADQSNVPFKHKYRKGKYGVSDSPASAIG